jgi:hypothetical protein
MILFSIKAKYFPFAYIFYAFISGASVIDMIIGIVIGHLYLYLKEILPLSTGKTYLKTPELMYKNNF